MIDLEEITEGMDLYTAAAFYRTFDAVPEGAESEAMLQSLVGLAHGARDYLEAVWQARTTDPLWTPEEVELQRADVRDLMV